MSVEETSGPNYGILAQRFISSGQWDRSLTTSLEWLGKEPDNTRAHRFAAQSLVNLDREAEAEPHLARVLTGNPKDDFAHRLMSMVYFAQGRFKAADESILKAISLNPHDAHHWHLLASMSYKRRDLVTAKKSAEKARELSPRDANILNLLILCEPNSPDSAAQKIRHFEEALEMDPENANIYNNIGAQYLDGLKDYAKAEEFFRKALFFEPASKLFRKNLFVTVKHRDKVYRALCAPKDALFKVISFFSRIRKQSIVLYIVMIPLWIVAFRFVLVGLLLWFMLVWPLTKVYEYLTIGDIRTRAGELGARKGGFLGYRTWSLKLRLSLFAFFLVLFWGAVAFALLSGGFPPENERVQAVLGGLLVIAFLLFCVYWLKTRLSRGAKAMAARRRSGQMAGILESATRKQKWP